MFLLNILLLFSTSWVSSSGDPQWKYCRKSNAEINQKRPTLPYYVPVFVPKDPWFQSQQENSVYHLLLDKGDSKYFVLMRQQRVSSQCWETDQIRWPFKNSSSFEISVMDHEKHCNTKKYGEEFFISDLYMKSDLSLGVIVICEDEKRFQIVIANYYLYHIYYKMDWRREVRVLMEQYNDTGAEDLLEIGINDIQRQFFKKSLYLHECQEGCGVAPKSLIQESSLGLALGCYVLYLIVMILAFKKLFRE